MWLLVGVGLTLFLVADPLGVSPVDEWLGMEKGDSAGSGIEARLWTCGMHPEVLQEEPGICPICQMDLVPLDDPASPEGFAGTGGHGDGNGNGHGFWTCSMHPMIEEEEPGQCPICGMELVPSEAGDQQDEGHGRAVSIDPTVVQNMNVSIEQVERRDLTRSVRTVGHLDYDQEAMVSVTTRYSGFVERVFADSVGQRVRQGEPLFEVYAPELVQTQRELLSALEYARDLEGSSPEVRRRSEQLVAAARTRLSYWEVTAEQIAAIESSGEVLQSLEVVSPISGVIMKRVHGLEGMAITPGMDVVHVADLSTLWLTVEVFEDQLPWISEGSTGRVRLDYFPGESFTARVRFIEPEVSPQTRTVRLTLEVPNRGSRLRVGMYATVEFEPVVARDAVVVPSQAVIRSGERDVVVLDLGDGRFAPREITVGVQSDGLLQVLEGLDGSERIVTSAQFLIDSESNLRAAIDKLRAGHNHGGGR
jgi:Cu(I)/Ag(I) efflux system membrane fusion protein/cobalt-zinc-cadmium efflux system membrane fusion protein